MARDTANTIVPAYRADLTGTRCPMTFVHAKAALDAVESGQVVELVLLEGEQIQDVPKNLKEEGHRVIGVTHKGDRYHLFVRKDGR